MYYNLTVKIINHSGVTGQWYRLTTLAHKRFGLDFRLAKLFPKTAADLGATNDLLLPLKCREYFSSAKTQTYTPARRWITTNTCMYAGPATGIGLMSSHCTDLQPAQSGIRTCDCSWLGKSKILFLSIICIDLLLEYNMITTWIQLLMMKWKNVWLKKYTE